MHGVYFICIAHWFEHSANSTASLLLILALRIKLSIAIRFGLFPLCCADESTKAETVLCADCLIFLAMKFEVLTCQAVFSCFVLFADILSHM